jgi:hypothetical protein
LFAFAELRVSSRLGGALQKMPFQVAGGTSHEIAAALEAGGNDAGGPQPFETPQDGLDPDGVSHLQVRLCQGSGDQDCERRSRLEEGAQGAILS